MRLDYSLVGCQLITDRGALAIGGDADESDDSVVNALAHMHICNQWVSYASRNIPWLPPDYCLPRCGISGITLAFGSNGRAVASIQFDLSKWADVGPTAPDRLCLYKWKRPERWALAGTPKPLRTKSAEQWQRILRRIGIRFRS
jgi:hypothetical protein